MFYETKENDHGLKYNPFKSCVVPRPIAWITSRNLDNSVNVAPYSYFNAISDLPPMIMFASSEKKDGDAKDTLKNIKRLGEFVINIVGYDDHKTMKSTSFPYPYGKSEAEINKIKLEESELVSVPRIASSPIKLECKLVKLLDLSFDEFKVKTKMVVAHVVGVDIKDDYIIDGMIDITKFNPVARLGYNEYCMIDRKFKLDNA